MTNAIIPPIIPPAIPPAVLTNIPAPSPVVQEETRGSSAPEPRVVPGPLARAVLNRDATVISPSYTRSYPFVMSHGRDCEVWDVDGNRFIDFNAGVAVLATGHCHPDIVAAIQEQAARYVHMAGTDFYLPVAVELAERLVAITPGAYEKRVFFTNSGTESIEAAMKLARYASKRQSILAFTGAFHGRTYGSLSLSNSKALHRSGFGPMLAGVAHIPYPDPYRCQVAHNHGEACADYVLDYLEKVIFKQQVLPKDVAAIFVEPIQGEGGYIVPPPNFLPRLREITSKAGIALVVDEVQSGVGRTGLWWAVDHSEVVPDIICLAKGIASGLPLGAIVASSEMMSWESGTHANTFGGNPLACAAALKTLDFVERTGMENARDEGNYILSRLQDWPERYPCVGQVRGKGLMIGIEFVEDKTTKEPAHDLRDAIVERLFQAGMLVLGAGTSTLRLSPPLTVNRAIVDEALSMLEKVVADTVRQPQ